MIPFARFLQLFGLLLMPAALMIGFSSIPRAGEMEFGILMLGVAVFVAGRMAESRTAK